jgi:hypothetical protein
MNRAIHTAASTQTRIGGVDDGVDPDFCDVADHQTEFFPVREIDLHDGMVAG